MTNIESGSLVECEAVIERGVTTFVDVGDALMRIRDGKLYAEPTFDDYCERRWGFSRSRASQLIGAARVIKEIGGDSESVTIVTKTDPAIVKTAIPPESQIRQLTSLDTPEERREAWAEAVATAPKDKAGKPKPTAKAVKKAVEKVKAKRAPAQAEVSVPTEAPEPIKQTEPSEVTEAESSGIYEPKEDARPWTEMEAALRKAQADLRAIARDIQTALQFDSKTNRYNHQYARGYTSAALNGAINQIIRSIDNGMPVELADNDRGYRTEYESHVHKARKNHA